jgi:hypothetical protein
MAVIDLCHACPWRRGHLWLVLFVLVALIAVAPAASPWARSAWGFADTVEIEINQQRFAIPSDYIATVAHDTHGSIKLVRLTVFWPTMEPLTNRAPQKLELPGPQGIYVLLRKRPRDGYQMLHAAIKLGWIDEQDEAGSFGLRAYIKDHERRRRTTRRYVSADSEVRTPSGDPIVFDCDDDFSWDAQETMDLEPTCKVNYVVAPNVGLTYWFYRKNLQSWREIDGSIRGLIESFAVGASTTPDADGRRR